MPSYLQYPSEFLNVFDFDVLYKHNKLLFISVFFLKYILVVTKVISSKSIIVSLYIIL